MEKIYQKLDSWIRNYGNFVLKWRILIILFSIAFVGLASYGAKNLAFKTDYRVFFSDENPDLLAFEEVQNVYTKTDNILIVVETENNTVFDPKTLESLEFLTAESWKIPFSTRVDSITNFQHSYAEEDDLIVDDLVENAANMTPAEIQAAKEVALSEPLLINKLINENASVSAINITLELPGKAIDEGTKAVVYARDLAEKFEEKYPGVNTYLTGVAMLNNAFQEASQTDMMTIVPLMFLGIIIALYLFMRSIFATAGVLMVIIFSVLTAMGLAGWAGIYITPPSSSAPTMIMTLAIADGVHFLITMLIEMRRHGLKQREAILESLRLNFTPILLTSVTTAIGFLTMNFSDSPPFHDLGNMTAMGVMAAFFFSVFTLPAVISLVPIKVKVMEDTKNTMMHRLGDFVVAYRNPLFYSMGALTIFLTIMISRNELNDQFVNYFHPKLDFRHDTDFAMNNLSGIYQVDHSIGSAMNSGINQPEYLATLEDFVNWYREQPGVVHVNTITDVYKKLNMNLHADNLEYYNLPESREMAAQYLLLYEMSLPYGLDLNNQINVDKSSTRVTVTLENMSTKKMRELVGQAEDWLATNAPESMFSKGTGTVVMFAYISKRNIVSMLQGTFFALMLISFILAITFRSFKFGALSLIPNMVPAFMAFGAWGLLVSKIDLGLSMVTGMTLGIVVDDTIHFLSKYIRARKEKELNSHDAVRYAFSTVGLALIVTTLVLMAGFGILSLSLFKMNSAMGQLTAMTIFLALVADFLLLPAVLMKFDKTKMETATNEEEEIKDDPALVPQS